MIGELHADTNATITQPADNLVICQQMLVLLSYLHVDLSIYFFPLEMYDKTSIEFGGCDITLTSTFTKPHPIFVYCCSSPEKEN